MTHSIEKENDDSWKPNINEWADFWRYEIGVDPIPANRRGKITNIEWSKYQNEAVSEEQYNNWKINGAFDNGMAIILGSIRRQK
jgi:hypothetical protein